MVEKNDFTVFRKYEGDRKFYDYDFDMIKDELLKAVEGLIVEDKVMDYIDDIENIVQQMVDEVNYNETRLNLYEYKFKQLKLFKENPIKWYESQFGKLKWYQKIQLMFLLWKEEN